MIAEANGVWHLANQYTCAARGTNVQQQPSRVMNEQQQPGRVMALVILDDCCRNLAPPTVRASQVF